MFIDKLAYRELEGRPKLETLDGTLSLLTDTH